jgi:single-strand DNA-binding protein
MKRSNTSSADLTDIRTQLSLCRGFPRPDAVCIDDCQVFAANLQTRLGAEARNCVPPICQFRFNGRNPDHARVTLNCGERHEISQREEEGANAMSKSVNKNFLMGHVGKDPEVRALLSDTIVANFSLATNEVYRDKMGESHETTEWHNLVAYGRTAEIVRDYVRKGSRIFIEGKLRTRSWDDRETGEKKYRTEVVIRDLTLLSSSNGNGNGNGHQTNGKHGYPEGAPANADDRDYEEAPLDDPF